MCIYVRLAGSLAQNLFRRVRDDLADCVVYIKRGCVYKMTCLRQRFDDVGPDEGDTEDYVALPEHQAELVLGLEKYAWFSHMDRKSAQDFVQREGQGSFIVRPSSSTRSLTLTLYHGNRTYNILVRRREDGLIALGSKKHNELAFRTVEDMCNHYADHELILYSGGEFAGKTLLKFPSYIISQPRLSSTGTPTEENQSFLSTRLSTDGLDPFPRTLEESFLRSAQRSMSLRSFGNRTENFQLQKNEKSSSATNFEHSDVKQYHKSYQNIQILNVNSLQSSVGSRVENKSSKSELPHQPYENISSKPVLKCSINNFISVPLTLTDIEKEVTRNKELDKPEEPKIPNNKNDVENKTLLRTDGKKKIIRVKNSDKLHLSELEQKLHEKTNKTCLPESIIQTKTMLKDSSVQTDLELNELDTGKVKQNTIKNFISTNIKSSLQSTEFISKIKKDDKHNEGDEDIETTQDKDLQTNKHISEKNNKTSLKDTTNILEQRNKSEVPSNRKQDDEKSNIDFKNKLDVNTNNKHSVFTVRKDLIISENENPKSLTHSISFNTLSTKSIESNIMLLTEELKNIQSDEKHNNDTLPAGKLTNTAIEKSTQKIQELDDVMFDKYDYPIINKTKLTASFFEKLAKKNQM